jgi:hypothetical protein
MNAEPAHLDSPFRYAADTSRSARAVVGNGRGRRTPAAALMRLFVAVAVGGAVLGLRPPMADAIQGNCGSNAGYHYAGEWTSYTNSLTHCSANNAYFGWLGVRGQITTPSSNPSLPDYTKDHRLGWLGAQFTSYTATLQTGWFTGTLGTYLNCVAPTCVRRNGTYGRYVENLAPTGYSVLDYGTVALGSSTTSRVTLDPSTGCWRVWLSFLGGWVQEDCSEPGYGAMVATTEMYSLSGNFVSLPTAYFGVNDPSSTGALQLVNGSNTFESWDQTLTAHSTERFDERYSTPKYQVSHFPSNLWWHFEAYSG